jgi:hypothetical protein
MVKSFDFVPESCTVGQHGDTDMMYGKTPVTPLNIGLELLLVSRQIYHEARLKPFSEIKDCVTRRRTSGRRMSGSADLLD